MTNLLKRCFENVDNLKNFQKFGLPEEYHSRLLVNLGKTVDKAVDDWISDPLGREKMENVLGDLSRRELEICRYNLECRLRQDVIELLFGDNLEEVNQKTFSRNDISAYAGSLNNTDFGHILFGENIMIGNIGTNESLDKKILLQVQSRIDRSVVNGMLVNVPFNEQYRRGSDRYMVDVNDVDVKYIGKKDRIERVLKLIDFVQKIESFLKNVSGDRKLGIFGKHEK